MKILAKITLISGLLILNTQGLLAEESDSSYMDALSKEAGQTKMKKEAVNAPLDEPEAEAKTTDNKQLTDDVSKQLEKLLAGNDSKDIKQEDLANIVSSAVQAGHDIDIIQAAVKNAMTELRGKEDSNIKTEVLEFSVNAVNEIVSASKDIATGTSNDPYIESLRAEADDETDDSTESEQDTGESRKETTTAKSESKPRKKDSAKTTDKVRTIIVLKGESLSKIAEKIYGSSRKLSLLYEANKSTLKDPNNIRVGQILKVPPMPE
jgi:nucleoid-associated protein YgaU